MEYEEMLKRAYSQLPPEVFEHKRFEFPKAKSTIAGSKTFLYNFNEICDILNRDPRHLLKYLSKEMATAGSTDGVRVVFQGKFNRDSLEHLINSYTEQFVICPVCKRPDTKIKKEKRLYFLVCAACGAKSSIKAV